MLALQHACTEFPLPCRGEDRSDIMGLILVKDLLQFWQCAESPVVRQLRMRPLPKLPVSTPMFDVLNFFQVGTMDRI